MKWFYSIVALFVGMTIQSMAQDTSLQQQYLQQPVEHHSFDNETWKKSTESLDYSDKRPPKKEQEIKVDDPPPEFSISDQTIRVIAFAVLFLVLIIILMRVFEVNIFSLGKKKKEGEAYSVEEFDDKIPESELDRMLREALERRDFRMAIRIYYLMVIRTLSERKMILWQKEKTNFNYVGELYGKEHYSGFRETTLVFERVWYGERSVDEQYYNEASTRFKSFLSELK